MDRNTLIGFSLIFLILVGYYWWSAPSEQELANQKRMADSLAKTEAAAKKNTQTANVNDTLQPASDKKDSSLLKDIYGGFAGSFGGTPTEITLANASVSVTFTTMGGRPTQVKLNQFKRADSTDLILLDKKHTNFYYEITTKKDVLRTDRFNWKVVSKTPESVSFRLDNGNGGYIEQKYTLSKQDFLLDYAVKVSGLENEFQRNNDLKLVWTAMLHKQEKGMQFENQHSNISYRIPGEHPESLSSTSPEKIEKIPGNLQWVAFKQQYFNATIINKDGFAQGGNLEWKETREAGYIKDMKSELYLPYSRENEKTWNMSFFFGPNSYKTLQSVNPGFADHELHRMIPLGWGIFGWVNRWLVLPVFNFLVGKIGSMGILILILTLIIKFILLPLVYKSYISTAKMRILKPEIDQIKEKYGNDMQKIQVENLALYKKAGVNPMSGCVPMLLQMPILFALFQFFPVLFELRQKTFLWSTDLSAYDSILEFGFHIPGYGSHISLFTLLMTISTLIYTHLNNQISGVTGQMKWIGYIMPIIFLGVLNDYPSGLTWYYFVSNMVTFGQQFAIRKLVDDQKLHQQIAEARKKPVKKSNFSRRLEEVMKAQQQKTQTKPRKPGGKK
ncbi:MAG: membrane protein insertase YidC [Bacteroidetes bacterium]|jgi:YidC/Oxa1 family membrane protein insertase|nr:membrane protein insertase YidC [Bacteroidota bacterium]